MPLNKQDRTLIKELTIEKFRGLSNIHISFGEKITVICGKNGTFKSTILGILAQICSFEKDYTNYPDINPINFKTLGNYQYKSQFSKHFRLSRKFDNPKEMRAIFYIHDGYSKKDLSNLKLSFTKTSDRDFPRPVVRNNTSIVDEHGKSINTSRNITHPVIFLSVGRLLPITERQKYEEGTNAYIAEHKNEILNDINNLLCKNPNKNILTATEGTISSIVSHDDKYDIESVSVGDDNAGQLIEALYSFRYLSEKYENYHGGLFLIDEADAALFPAAQEQLIDILNHFSKQYDIQIVITSHSPIIIEKIYQLSQKSSKSKKSENDFNVVYLTDSYGDISVQNNLNWEKINADLYVRTIQVSAQNYPQINVYLEDDEARHFFKRLITNRKIKKVINISEATIGCKEYERLLTQKIQEFSEMSVVCLDGDFKTKKQFKTVVLLPGDIPPDQLLFLTLYNLKEDDAFWKNKINFSKMVFYRESNKILSKFPFGKTKPLTMNDFSNIIKEVSCNRELFKNFFKNPTIQEALRNKSTDPFCLWLNKNKDSAEEFKTKFYEKLKYCLSKKGCPLSQINILFS